MVSKRAHEEQSNVKTNKKHWKRSSRDVMTWKNKRKSGNVCISRGVFGVVAAVIVLQDFIHLQLTDTKLSAIHTKMSLDAEAPVRNTRMHTRMSTSTGQKHGLCKAVFEPKIRTQHNSENRPTENVLNTYGQWQKNAPYSSAAKQQSNTDCDCVRLTEYSHDTKNKCSLLSVELHQEKKIQSTQNWIWPLNVFFTLWVLYTPAMWCDT